MFYYRLSGAVGRRIKQAYNLAMKGSKLRNEFVKAHILEKPGEEEYYMFESAVMLTDEQAARMIPADELKKNGQPRVNSKAYNELNKKYVDFMLENGIPKSHAIDAKHAVKAFRQDLAWTLRDLFPRGAVSAEPGEDGVMYVQAGIELAERDLTEDIEVTSREKFLEVQLENERAEKDKGED